MVDDTKQHYDNHALETFQTCPRKYELQILGGWRPRQAGRALEFGAAMHEGLAAWYRTQPDDLPTLMRKMVRLLKEVPSPHQLDMATVDPHDPFQVRQAIAVYVALSQLPPVPDIYAGDFRTHDLLESLMRRYTELYRYEPFKTMHVERSFVFSIPRPGTNEDIPYFGLLDLVVDWAGVATVIDHKTTTRLHNFGSKWSPNQQISGYIMGCQVGIVPATSSEACINAILLSRRKDGVRPEDFERYPNIHRTPEELDEFVRTVIATVEDIERCHERKYFPMTTSSCNMYNGCEYLPICSLPPSNRDSMLNHLFVKQHWNPLTRDAGEKHIRIYTE